MPVPKSTTPPAGMPAMLTPAPEFVPQAMLAAAPSDPFFLKHWPGAWEVASEGLDAPHWLPTLKKHTIRPGVNHTRTLKRGDAMDAAWRDGVEQATREGWIVLVAQATQPLDPKHLPPGVPAGGYLRAIPCQHPTTRATGTHYTEAWAVPVEAPLPGEVQPFKFHRATYNRWRLHLVEIGAVPLPRDAVLERIRSSLEARVPRVRALGYGDAEAKAAALERVTRQATDADTAKVPAPRRA